jgi:hypothetical protein
VPDVPVFTFDEATHTYTLDGVKLPSVTTIIRPIGPDFSAIPPDVLEQKRAFGVAVHTACELDDLGELDDEATDPRVMRCVAAWRRFKVETEAEVLATEQRLYHPTLRFAGTLDGLLRIAARKGHGTELWLIDRKTSDEPHASYGVQLCGYRMLLDAQPDGRLPESLVHRGTVHLFDDGTYRLHPFKNPNDEAAFRACLSIHQWKEAQA